MRNHSFISTLGFGWLAAACVRQQRIWLVWVKTECFGLLRKGPGSVLGIGIGIGIDLKSTKVARVLMTAHSQTARTASKEPIYDSGSKISQK